MLQFIITPAMGKRLIAKAVAKDDDIQEALTSRNIVVVAGTTNGYVAEELLASIGRSEGFSRDQFFRGVTLPPTGRTTDLGQLIGRNRFPGDVVITKGTWQKGKVIFDVIEELKAGDIILKGANAINLTRNQVGILIGDPKGGTGFAAFNAAVGKRVRMMFPVGLEKRVEADMNDLAALMNDPESRGPRLLPVYGRIITEIEALQALTGVRAELVASGGVGGAEGAVYIAVFGTTEQEQAAKTLITSLSKEPQFTV